MAKHLETGKWGEELAARHLEQKGYQLIEKNFRFHHAEIDLIAQKGKLLIFVEVKTRTSLQFGNPEEFVSAAKAQLVMKAAEQYIFTKDWYDDVRFDIIAVTITPEAVQVMHWEDVFP